jgi:hypothetical protein
MRLKRGSSLVSPLNYTDRRQLDHHNPVVAPFSVRKGSAATVAPAVRLARTRSLPIAVALVLALGTGATANAATKAHHRVIRESYSALQSQISSRLVRQATVTPKTRTVKVRLRTGVKYLARYPKGADPTAALRAHGAHVRVHRTSGGSTVRIRYIVLGVLVLIAVVGGAIYLVRRRRPGPAQSGAAA